MKRYRVGEFVEPPIEEHDGGWVRYSDHVDALATVRKEEREAAFKIQCADCAQGDTPTIDADARWFYHYEGTSDVIGCMASKLRREWGSEHKESR